MSDLNPTADSANKAKVSQQFVTNGQQLSIPVDRDEMEFLTSTTHYDQLKNALAVKESEIQWKSNNEITVILFLGETKSDSWQWECLEEVCNYLDKCSTRDVEVNKHFWEAVKTQLSNICACFGVDPPLVKPIDDAFVLKVVSLSTDAEKFEDQLKAKLEELYREETRKTYLKLTTNVAEDCLILLKKIKFAERLQENNKELEIKLDTETKEICFEGPQTQFIEATAKFHKLDMDMVEKNLSVSKNIWEVLVSNEGLQRVNCELEENNVEAVFVIDKVARIVGTSAAHADKAASLVSKLVLEEKVRADDKSQSLLKTEEWHQLCEKLNTEDVVRVYRHESSDTFVAGFREDVSEAMKRLDAFLENNCIRKEQYNCSSTLVRRYLSEFRQDDLRSIETQLAHFKVVIRNGKGDYNFAISGKKEGLKYVKTKLRSLESRAISGNFDVKQPGVRKLLSSGEGDRLIKSVEKGHACSINVQTSLDRRLDDIRTSDAELASENDSSSGEDDEEDDEEEGEEEKEEEGEEEQEKEDEEAAGPCSLITSNGHKISWRAERIECEEASILVSSKGACAQAIITAGGLVMKQRFANPNSGDITVIPGSGTLACNHVIHTNCCNWNGYGGSSEIVLQSIVQKCLLKGEELGGKSIAFPGIGTGSLDFPPAETSRIMLEETIHFCEANPTSTLKNIRFVLYNPRDLNLIMAFRKEFEKLKSKPSRPVKARDPASIKALQRALGRKSNDAPGVFKNTGLSIEVINGDLTQEKTDAIINIISTNMNLKNAGELSKAILRVGGPQIQKECSHLGKQTPGSAVMTSGGSLAVSRVIHIIPGSQDKQHLQTCLEAGLRLADTRKLRLISIPSLGTGGYGLAAADSAQITFKALSNFSRNCKSVLKVRVIVFQASMMQEFLKAQKEQAVKEDVDKQGRNSVGTLDGRPRKRRSTPKILSNDPFVKFEVIGKDRESVKKAVDSLKKGFFKDYPARKVEDDTVSQFSKKQIHTLMKQANDRDVKLEIEADMNRVVVSGELTEVLDMVNQIWRVINNRNKKIQKEQKELVLKNVEWSFEIGGMKSPFDPETNVKIEMAYSREQATVRISLRADEFFIDLKSETGIGRLTRKTIKVFRKLKGADEGIPLPKDWEPMPRHEMTVHTVTLAPGSSEYQDVMGKVQATASGVKIQKIQRVQNPYLYQCYMLRKKDMDKSNTGNNERKLFHGTNTQNVPAINTQGFNRSFCGVHGAAFARPASYSVIYERDGGVARQMYLARVLVGTYCQGNSSLKVPPPKNPSRPEILYDSVVDNTGNPAIFVVFHDNQCYPEYLITFNG